MTLNRCYAPYCTKHASFGAHHENLNENRPTLSAAKIYPNDSTFWLYKVYADVRGGFRGEGRQTAVGLSTTATFNVFGR